MHANVFWRVEYILNCAYRVVKTYEPHMPWNGWTKLTTITLDSHRISQTICEWIWYHCKYSRSNQQIRQYSWWFFFNDMANEVHELKGVKILRFPRYRHICLRAPGKCACNATNALQTQPRYRPMFSVSQECVYNEYCCISQKVKSKEKVYIIEKGKRFLQPSSVQGRLSTRLTFDGRVCWVYVEVESAAAPTMNEIIFLGSIVRKQAQRWAPSLRSN